MRVWLALVVLAGCMVQEYLALPYSVDPNTYDNNLGDCRTDDELLELCQRCAKETKVPGAYMTCCSSDISARQWCNEYLYFGEGHKIRYGDKFLHDSYI